MQLLGAVLEYSKLVLGSETHPNVLTESVSLLCDLVNPMDRLFLGVSKSKQTQVLGKVHVSDCSGIIDVNDVLQLFPPLLWKLGQKVKEDTNLI